MKLNPEELEIVSFETDELSAYAPVTVDQGFPTPDSRCFVCD
ncbi:hypothetical protein [Longimicrobium sp.]|nr:hypothetical protein [Longimicrobium sp.]HEX6040186.1 hypothetical protein [Longimicrobium sp.]